MSQIQSLNDLSTELEQAFKTWAQDPSNSEHSNNYASTVKNYTAKLDTLKSAFQASRQGCASR